MRPPLSSAQSYAPWKALVLCSSSLSPQLPGALMAVIIKGMHLRHVQGNAGKHEDCASCYA